MTSRLHLTILFTLLFLSSLSHSTVLTFTDRASFDAALVGTSLPVDAHILDFDYIPIGTTLSNGDALGDIVFSTTAGGGTIDMMIDDQFDTTSGNNYLGLDDPGNFNQFIAGDGINLFLGGPYNALGLYVITSDPLLDGDIILQTPVGSALNSSLEEQTLSDGGLVYFIGLVSTNPTNTFGLASIQFDPAANAAFFYNVDDIITAKLPMPPSIILILLGILTMPAVKILNREKTGE